MTHEQDELRARFAHLREYDRATAPELRVAHRRSSARAWLAAAAVLVIASGVALRQMLISDPGDAPDPTVTITTWRSPTAGLLRPASQLPNAALLSSVLDGAAASHVYDTGDSR